MWEISQQHFAGLLHCRVGAWSSPFNPGFGEDIFFLMGIPLLGESIGHTVVVVFWGGPEAIPSQNRCSDISHEESLMMVG